MWGAERVGRSDVGTRKPREPAPNNASRMGNKYGAKNNEPLEVVTYLVLRRFWRQSGWLSTAGGKSLATVVGLWTRKASAACGLERRAAAPGAADGGEEGGWAELSDMFGRDRQWQKDHLEGDIGIGAVQEVQERWESGSRRAAGNVDAAAR
jgi:hypothetical protein